jgi:hypothetical protein
MNNDQYNNQNNLTDNAPIASPGAEDMKKQLTFTEAPAVAEPLPTVKADKERTIGITIAFVTFCVVLVDVMIKDDSIYSLPEFIRITLIAYILVLSIVMIKMCIFRQYWVTDRVMGGITIIPLTCIGIAAMFALIYYIYYIYNIQDTVPVLVGAVVFSFVVFIPLLIVVSVIYCSWAMLSYHKKSTSNIEKK